jgi:hypothetical protein
LSLVSFVIFGLVFVQQVGIRPAQFDLQFTRDRMGDVAVQALNIRHRPGELLAPDHGVILGRNKLTSDRDRIAGTNDPTPQDRLDIQFFAYSPGIRIVVSKGEYRITRHHTKIGDPRKRKYHAFREAVTEICQGYVPGLVLERQDGDRALGWRCVGLQILVCRKSGYKESSYNKRGDQGIRSEPVSGNLANGFD